jgi:hypothetical protein
LVLEFSNHQDYNSLFFVVAFYNLIITRFTQEMSMIKMLCKILNKIIKAHAFVIFHIPNRFCGEYAVYSAKNPTMNILLS